MQIIATTDLKKIPPVLRAKAEEVSDVLEIAPQLDEFVEALHHSGGIGLAATQVGIEKRFFAVEIPSDTEHKLQGTPLTILINPEIVKRSDEWLKWQEGCLSLPGWKGMTVRAKSVKVKALNRFGKKVTVKAEGLFACAIQHELDHLNGVLFIDHATEIARESDEETSSRVKTDSQTVIE